MHPLCVNWSERDKLGPTMPWDRVHLLVPITPHARSLVWRSHTIRLEIGEPILHVGRPWQSPAQHDIKVRLRVSIFKHLFFAALMASCCAGLINLQQRWLRCADWKETPRSLDDTLPLKYLGIRMLTERHREQV
jgi:hypothetical protein